MSTEREDSEYFRTLRRVRDQIAQEWVEAHSQLSILCGFDSERIEERMPAMKDYFMVKEHMILVSLHLKEHKPWSGCKLIELFADLIDLSDLVLNADNRDTMLIESEKERGEFPNLN